MVKKLLIILGSLTISYIIISGGYGIWQDELEVEGKIKIMNPMFDISLPNPNGTIINNTYGIVENDVNTMDLNYIYIAAGDSAYSYMVEEYGSVNYTGIHGANEHAESIQNEIFLDENIGNKNNIPSGYSSNVNFINNIKDLNQEEENIEPEGNNQDTLNYIYVLDEYESMNTFKTEEVKNQQGHGFIEGSNMNYIYQSAGTN